MRGPEHAANLLRAAGAAMRPRPAERPVARLLVIGYGAIGDTIFFLPVLESLRRAHPQARLVWLSNPAPVADELIPATGLADEVWRWEARGDDPAGRAALNRRIAEAGFDLAVLTLGAPAHEFLAPLSRVPVVAGHLRPRAGLKRWIALGDYARSAVVNRPAPVVAGEHALDRNVRLLAALGLPGAAARPSLPVTPAARARAEGLLAGAAAPLVALHLGPTGNQYEKMWAPESFAELSRRLASAWPGTSLILVGSSEEAEAEKRFRAAGGVAARSLIGAAGLLETFAVLERCALLISNDTGVAKAAAALKVPSVTLWGPSDPAEFRAPWEKDLHVDVRTGISCSPCTAMGMPSSRFNYLNCGHHDCLRRLEVSAVLGAVLKRWPTIGTIGVRP